MRAGLGLKKIRLENDDDESEVMKKLMSSDVGFPQLAQAGGFELLRSQQNCRNLQLIESRWNSKELKSYVGSQAKIYIRPVQSNLSTQPLHSVPIEEDFKSVCEICHNSFPVRKMREHLQECDLPDISESIFIAFPNTSDVITSETLVNERENTLEAGYTPAAESSEMVQTVITFPDLSSVNSEMNLQEMNETESTLLTDIVPAVESSEMTVSEVVDSVVRFCVDNDISNPVEILKKLQNDMVTGRPLEIEDVTQSLHGATHFILVDRSRPLDTAFEELSNMTASDLRLTLEVQFYDESAEDYGGPRKEFFVLALKSIKEKYFDHGLRHLLADDYVAVRIVFALSILQNGALPNFMGEDVLKELWHSEAPSPSILKLRQGLNILGIFEIVKKLPSMEFLFHETLVPLTVKKLTAILKPVFSENGSNNAIFEKEVYGKFIKYVHARSGKW